MSSETTRAIVTAVAGTGFILVVQWATGIAFAAYERRVEARDPEGSRRRRTLFSVLRRVLIALLIVIVTWNVLAIFPATQAAGRALLASSAVLAIFAGLALNTPLSNLGGGLLLAFTQPLRIGDRVTIGETTGFVEQIALVYTTLATDDDRRVFIPNSQMSNSVIINRSVKDPRRTITVVFHVSVNAAADAAQKRLEQVAQELGPGAETRVLLTDISERSCAFTVTLLAPVGTDVAAQASELRVRGLAALADAEMLPGS